MTIEWKWAIKNRLLCTWKSTGAIDIRTPVIPPVENVTINPKNQSIGVEKTNSSSKHRKEPVENFHARRNSDDHRHDPEESIDIGAGAHREEVVQPHDE